MRSDSLTGRRALVTGGTRGIGQAIARSLEGAGAEVTITGRSAAVGEVLHRAVDLSDRAATEAFAASIADERWDILINCAGINRISAFAEIDADDFDEIFAVNVRAPMLITRAVVPGMCERGWGRIVNISSIFGKISKAQRASYSASKFALDGLTAALAAEVAASGVLANCVAPGFIDTELTRTTLGVEGMERIVQDIPAGRLGTVGEVAALVLWLAGPENTYVSGQTIVIDGGFVRV